jgi:hypothetical protein
MDGKRNEDEYCLMMHVLGRHRLRLVLRLSSTSIIESETVEESTRMKFYLKWASAMEWSCGWTENIVFWWNQERVDRGAKLIKQQ